MRSWPLLLLVLLARPSAMAKEPPIDVADPRREVPDPANRPRPATPENFRPAEVGNTRDVSDPGNDPRRFAADPFEDEREFARGRHQLGAGGGATQWTTFSGGVTARAEVTYRFELVPRWRLTADGGWVAAGELGTIDGMNGISFAGGLLRELPIGAPPRWYPTLRTAIAVETLSGRHAERKLVALRGGPGLEWEPIDHMSLCLDLEVTAGLLWTDPLVDEADGSTIDVAVGAVGRLLVDL
ncbi:MAG: hypothetical protein HYY06_00750 [Deltaproteobacteria bacterium]|nr:hypothetical protein [Deltaproteobacteria bacterium]